jgi:hypothetical protein
MLGWTFLDVFGRFATFGNWRSLGTFREVGGHFATFGDVWGCLEHIYKQVSTCSKDDAILHHA